MDELSFPELVKLSSMLHMENLHLLSNSVCPMLFLYPRWTRTFLHEAGHRRLTLVILANLGGRDQEDHGPRPAGANSSQ
jgi:hypothetical protein